LPAILIVLFGVAFALAVPAGVAPLVAVPLGRVAVLPALPVAVEEPAAVVRVAAPVVGAVEPAGAVEAAALAEGAALGAVDALVLGAADAAVLGAVDAAGAVVGVAPPPQAARMNVSARIKVMIVSGRVAPRRQTDRARRVLVEEPVGVVKEASYTYCFPFHARTPQCGRVVGVRDSIVPTRQGKRIGLV